MLNIIRIRSIHHLLTQEASASLVLSLCISHLDYCNSIFYCLPDSTIEKLQHIQNMCACFVLRRTKWDSAMACLASLHWLPIKQQIKFKISVHTYKLLHNQGPKYLSDLIQYKSVDSRLRSSNDPLLLLIPRAKLKMYADRSFKVSAPTTWNDLPYHVRSSTSLLTFKNTFKTHLFKEAFNQYPCRAYS